MSVTIVVGGQRGDEGKGRFTDMLAQNAAIVARGQGGNNAGHTVCTDDGIELALHSVPSGIAYKHTVNIVGRGCLVNAEALCKEIEDIRSKGLQVTPDNFMISSAAHLILPHHISADEIREAGASKQGSTKTGIAPTASSKYGRDVSQAMRAEVINNSISELQQVIATNLELQKPLRKKFDLPEIDSEQTAKDYVENAAELGEYITDTEVYLHRQLQKNPEINIVAEGAQAFWLDVDHGMWPYVTSSSTTAGGVINGLGIPAKYVTDVIEVSKMVQSHVGGGPFVTEIFDESLLKKLHGNMTTIDAEKGTTTGRVRRLGYLDLPGLRRSQWINGTTQMAITKLDWVPRFGKTIKICTSYTRKGKTLDVAPDAGYKLEQSTPNYAELPNWNEDIQSIRNFKDLPKNAQDYILFLEDQTKLPITMIGVGPRRDQVIIR